MDKTELTWNVYVSSFSRGTIEIFNIFSHDYFLDGLKKISRAYKDTQREEFCEHMRKELLYYFWSRTQWEVIIDHWPHQDKLHDKKVDVYEQVRLNWEPKKPTNYERLISMTPAEMSEFLGKSQTMVNTVYAPPPIANALSVGVRAVGLTGLWRRKKKMLEIIVEIEWLVLGIVFFCGLRRWNRRFTQLYNDMIAEDEEDKL